MFETRRRFDDRVAGLSRCLTASLLTAALTASATLAGPGEGDDAWSRLEFDNVVVFSNASLETATAVGRDFQTIRAGLASSFPVIPDRSSTPVRVYAFRDDDSFRPFAGPVSRTNAQVDARFLPGSDAIFAAFTAGPSSDDAPEVQRRYANWLLREYVPDLPFWLVEGLSDLHATHRVEEGNLQIGAPNLVHTGWLVENPSIPVVGLLELGVREFRNPDRDRLNLLRARSWAIVHYLYVGNPTLAGALPAYLELRAEGAGVDESLRATLGLGADELSANVKHYVEGGELLQGTLASDVTIPSKPESMRDLSPAQVLAALGSLLTHDRDADEATAANLFAEALELQPDLADAHRGLGALLERQGRHDEAIASYRRVLEHDPRDGLAAYRLGRRLLERHLAAPDSALPLAPVLEGLDRAVALAPDFAPALAALGKAQVLRADCELGAPALEIARQRLPSRIDLASDLAWFHARCGRPARARALLDEVLEPLGAPEQERSALRSALLGSELREVQRMAMGGDPAGAAALLGRLVEETEDPTMRARLAAKLDQLRVAGDRQTWVGRYTEAQRLAAEGMTDDAMTLYRRIRERANQPDLVEASAEQLRLLEGRPGTVSLDED